MTLLMDTTYQQSDRDKYGNTDLFRHIVGVWLREKLLIKSMSMPNSSHYRNQEEKRTAF